MEPIDLRKYALTSKYFAPREATQVAVKGFYTEICMRAETLLSHDLSPDDVPLGLLVKNWSKKKQAIPKKVKSDLAELSIPTQLCVKKKQAIPKKVKSDVWNTYIGADINAHRCLCCKKTRIQIMDFQVGHVLSEKFGGTMEIGNLRPICAACNSSMGTRNMIEFVKTYGYYIG